MKSREPIPEVNLLPGEKVIQYITKVTYSMKSTGGIRSYDIPTTELIVTNKRILVSYGGMSFGKFAKDLTLFYTESDYRKYKGFMSNYLIEKYSLGKNSVIISFSGFLFKTELSLHTKQNRLIFSIIKKNRK